VDWSSLQGQKNTCVFYMSVSSITSPLILVFSSATTTGTSQFHYKSQHLRLQKKEEREEEKRKRKRERQRKPEKMENVSGKKSSN
jgi:hypothetical protein